MPPDPLCWVRASGLEIEQRVFPLAGQVYYAGCQRRGVAYLHASYAYVSRVPRTRSQIADTHFSICRMLQRNVKIGRHSIVEITIATARIFFTASKELSVDVCVSTRFLC